MGSQMTYRNKLYSSLNETEAVIPLGTFTFIKNNKILKCTTKSSNNDSVL